MSGSSAVIVHYRTPEQTVRAARAVAETAPEVAIVVVDNASGDAIGQRLGAEVPSARLVTEGANRGYGAACNRSSRPLWAAGDSCAATRRRARTTGSPARSRH